MPIEHLHITNIHSLKRLPANRSDGARTRIDAETATQGRLQFDVPGFPPVSEGMRVSAWLDRGGDWNTLAGWRDWTHDTLVLQPPGFTMAWLAGSALCALIFGGLGLGSLLDRAPDAFALGMAVASLLTALMALLKYRKQRRIQLALQQALPPDRAAGQVF